MSFEIFRTGPRFIVLKISDGGKYNTLNKYDCQIIPKEGGVIPRPETITYSLDRSVSLITGLYPDMDYEIRVCGGGEEFIASFHTPIETATMNVMEFGAAGDGVHNDARFQRDAG